LRFVDSWLFLFPPVGIRGVRVGPDIELGMPSKRKAAGDAAPATPAFFNLRTPLWQLSNFVGDAELKYQLQTKFKQSSAATRLFKEFATCDKAKFLEYLARMRPRKKATKREFWVRDGEPVRGILAYLAARAICGNSPGARARLQQISLEISPGSAPLEPLEPQLTLEERIDAMMASLVHKFTKQPYKDLLLATGTRRLHYKPMRGTAENSFWAGDGEVGWGALGRLLEHVRAHLREERDAEDGVI
jgi:hypothetical protein